jgi:[ribosomal protein S5]-alanine N-acetyltransferase
MIITSDSIYLKNMNLNQLVNLLEYPCKVECDLNCSEIEDLLNDGVLPAINAKINKMKNIDQSVHLWFTYWVIILKNSNTAVGLIGFKGIPDQNGEVEVGYGVNQKFRKLGLATEALNLLKDWAFTDSKCTAITARNVLNKNIASQRVLGKTGLKLVLKDRQVSNWILRKGVLIK